MTPADRHNICANLRFKPSEDVLWLMKRVGRCDQLNQSPAANGSGVGASTHIAQQGDK